MALRRSEAVRIFAIPTVMAITSAVGLISALVGDGPWDALSWVTLGAPLAVLAWCTSRPART
jgi:hypothetical protein